MIHEALSNVQQDIESLLIENEVQFKSVRIAHYREASYFALRGDSFVYLISDCSFSGNIKFCYVGETSRLNVVLREHARSHRFSHAFVVDMAETSKDNRLLAKELLINAFSPILQGKYGAFESYRVRHSGVAWTTDEICKFAKTTTEWIYETGREEPEILGSGSQYYNVVRTKDEDEAFRLSKKCARNYISRSRKVNGEMVHQWYNQFTKSWME